MNVNREFKCRGLDKPQIDLLQGTQFAKLQTQNVFKNVEWTFHIDNSFTLTPSEEISAPSFFPILGTYFKSDNFLELKGERSSNGNTVSVDGNIQFDGETPVLNIIYILSLQSDFQIVARVSQELTLKANRESEVTNLARGPIPSIPTTIEQSTALSELDELDVELSAFRDLGELEIDPSSTMPQVYRVSLKGQSEAGKFGPLPVKLFITPSKDTGPPQTVSLMTEPEFIVSNGGICWNFAHSKTEKPNFNFNVKGNHHEFQINVASSGATSDVSWYTLPVEVFEDTPINVFVESAQLNLSIRGDAIKGELKGSGFYSPLSTTKTYPSTYYAKITGEIEKSHVAEQLKFLLNRSPFTGQWQTVHGQLGEITLQQDGQQVTGSYTGTKDRPGGTIAGTIQNNRLDFICNHDRQQGQGFVRAIASGGTLAGLWDNNKSATRQTFQATWKLPDFLIPETLNALDLRELRWLGHELALERRREQSVALLKFVLDIYRKEREKPETSFQDQTGYLTSEGFTLAAFLLECNLELGDYDRLLENLDYMLEVQRLLGPEESASRLFRERTLQLKESLKSQIETFTILQNGFTETIQQIEGKPIRGVVGLSLEPKEQTQELIITNLLEDGSASLAGIMLGDILVAINEQSTQGMDVEQVYKEIWGDPGTQVNLTLRRGQQELSLYITRQPLLVYSVNHQTELHQTFSLLASFFEALIATIDTFLNKLTQVEMDIARGKANPVKAWSNLASDLDTQQNHLKHETIRLRKLGLQVFTNRPNLLQDANFLLDNCTVSPGTRTLEVDIKELNQVENRFICSIEQDTQLSFVEKILFRAYLQASFSISTFSFQLDSELDYLGRIDAEQMFKENKQRSQEMVSRLANYIERWRSKLVLDLEKIEALDRGQSFFQRLVSLLSDLDDKEGALIASEKSRARALADLLVTQSRVEEQSKITSLLKIAESPTLEQIRRSAQNQDSILVEYAIVSGRNSENYIYIWVIDCTGNIDWISVELPSNETSLSELVVQARRYIGVSEETYTITQLSNIGLVKNSKKIQSQSILSNPLNALYQILIAPIHHLLQKQSGRHIVFIPQGILFLVPFAALQDNFGNFLFQQYVISIAPSIQVHQRSHFDKQNGKPQILSALVAGNPQMPKTLPRKDEAQHQSRLDSLSWAEIEAKVVATLLHAEPMIQKDATKVNVLRQIPNASLVHLATHGFLYEIDQLDMPGAIVLAPSDRDDGFLLTKEILDLKLKAELVVLSACKTGLGRISADGIVGLSRSFVAAGASSVLVSLWAVNDLSTTLLMKKFYQNWLQGMPVTIALNQAQSWLINLTKRDLLVWIEEHSSVLNKTLELSIKRMLKQKAEEEKIYQKPYYWAAFYEIS